MRLSSYHRKPAGLAEIRSTDPLTAAAEIAIRQLLLDSASFSVHGRFKPEGVLNKWGHAENLELAAIHVSTDAIGGIDPSKGLATIAGKQVCLALEATDGRFFGHKDCSSVYAAKAIQGVVLQDRRGRGWICPTGASTPGHDLFSDTSTVFTGEEPLREISLDTAPAVGMLCIASGAPDRLDAFGAFGGAFRLESDIVAGTTGRPIRTITAGHAHLQQGMARMAARVEAILAREDLIMDAARPHLEAERLHDVFAVKSFPHEGNLYPGYNAPGRKDFENRLFDLTRDIAISLRDAGVCAPCPNDGPHHVRGISAWNALLSGEIDGDHKNFTGALFWKNEALDAAPLFQSLRSTLIDTVVRLEMAFQEEDHPGEKRDSGTAIVMTSARYGKVLAAAADAVTDCLCRESGVSFASVELRSTLDENLRLHLAGSFLTPVLATMERDGTLIPLPVIDEPAPARHLQITLPSGRLAMADWFRIPGFTEAVEKLCDDNHAINQVSGLNARAKAYYENCGLAIVQVGNCSPGAFADTPGVWRLGHIDEDHEDFWTEDDTRTELHMPEPAWRTCTDLWANTFAAPEVIADILMASGQFADRAAADAAVETYCSEEYGASVTQLGVGTLHLYLPSGYGEQRQLFGNAVRAEEFDYPAWRKDMYLLSAEPLTLDPPLLEDNDWVEGRIDPAISARADVSSTPSPSF